MKKDSLNRNSINGLEEKQVFLLFNYLVAYEHSGIAVFKSTKKLLEAHPELSDLEQAIKPVTCHSSNAREMESINLNSLNEIYFTINKGNHLLSFLSHLRNSIAHGYVRGYNGNALITDFANPKYHPIDFTARGYIHFEIITKITKILERIEL